MKIIQVAGPSHREDGPPLYYLNALNGIPGVTCERKTVLDPPESWGSYDLVLSVDWAHDAFPHLPPFIPPRRSICIQSDTHWTDESFTYRLEQSSHYDLVLVNQLSAVEAFRRRGVPSLWHPHAGEHTCYTPPLRDHRDRPVIPPEPEAFTGLTMGAAPRWDVSFVGFIGDPGRVKFLDAFAHGIDNFYFGCNLFFEDCSRIYNRSKIALNKSVRGELNMRTFEILCSRAFLLTDRQDGMNDLGLRDGEHCAIYRTAGEAIEKARHYLSDDSARERIADAGWRWVLSGHTYWHRARKLLQLVDDFAMMKADFLPNQPGESNGTDS